MIVRLSKLFNGSSSAAEHAETRSNNCHFCRSPLPPSDPICKSCLRIGTHAGLAGIDFHQATSMFDPSAALVGQANMNDAIHGIEQLVLSAGIHEHLKMIPHRFILFRGKGDHKHVRLAYYQTEHFFGLMRGPRLVKANVDCTVLLGGSNEGSIQLEAQKVNSWGGGEWINVIAIMGKNGVAIQNEILESTSGNITGATATEISRRLVQLPV